MITRVLSEQVIVPTVTMSQSTGSRASILVYLSLLELARGEIDIYILEIIAVTITMVTRVMVNYCDSHMYQSYVKVFFIISKSN